MSYIDMISTLNFERKISLWKNKISPTKSIYLKNFENFCSSYYRNFYK